MLSTPEFAAFAKTVVPFLHVTTRIPDRKHEGLLSEKGFGGFPSLAFMDAAGEVVARPQDRSVDGFAKTRDALIQHADLTKRIEAGEEGLDFELLMAENELGKVTPTQFETRAKALEDLTEAQQARVDQIMLDGMIVQMANAARRDEAAFEAAVTTFVKILDDGKGPSQDSRVASGFWMTLGWAAMKGADAKLARRAAAGMRKDLPDQETLAKELEDTAAKIDDLDALKKRVEAGEEGLAPDVLVLEFDLGAVDADAFTEKAEPMLAAANETQKAAIEQRLRQIDFQKALSRSRDPAQREANAKRLLELLEDGAPPPEAIGVRVWQTLLAYGHATQDPDLMQRALDGMKTFVGSEPGFAKFATRVQADIDKMREAAATKEAEDEDAEEADADAEDAETADK